MGNKKILGTLSGIMTGICWSLSGVFAQFLFEQKDILANWMIPIRLVAAGIVLFAYSFITNREELFAVAKNKKDFIQAIIAGVFGTMMLQTTFFKAVESSNAGTATVLQYLAPIFILTCVCIREKKRPNKVEILCVALAFAGVFLIATHGNINSLSMTPKGLFWGIACAFGMFMDTVLPEKLNKKYSSVTIMAWAFLFGGIVAMFLMKPWKHVTTLDGIVILMVALTVLMGCITAYLLYRYSVKTVGPAKASLFASSELVSATLISVIWLGTPLIWIDFVGFALILLMVFIFTTSKQTS